MEICISVSAAIIYSPEHAKGWTLSMATMISLAYKFD
jgi:hypothetical protein